MCAARRNDQIEVTLTQPKKTKTAASELRDDLFWKRFDVV